MSIADVQVSDGAYIGHIRVSQPHHFLSHRTSETFVNPLLSRAFRSVTVWVVLAVVQHRVQHFLWQKSGTYYFLRRVPKDIQEYYTSSRVVICLETKRRDSAVKASRFTLLSNLE